MTSFSIAHLSDLHLTSNASDERSEFSFGRLRGMNIACNHVLKTPEVQACDLVLITGDVTDKGHLGAWDALNQMLLSARLRERTLIVAGNHDICGLSILRVRPFFGTNFRDVDLQKVKTGLMRVGQPTKYPWAKLVDPRVVVFGLDSNNSGNWTIVTNAVGKIGHQQLRRFAELLAVHKDVPVKIVALHHSPNIPEPITAIRRGQIPMSTSDRFAHQIPEAERRELRNLCVASRVRLIVHGHLHQAEDRRLGRIRIIGAPATTQPVDPNSAIHRFQFYRYTVLGNGGRVMRDLIDV